MPTPSSAAGFFRLAWDFAATALGSRNEQYERFYLGSVGRSLTMLQTNGDRTRANRLLDRFLTEELETGPKRIPVNSHTGAPTKVGRGQISGGIP